MWTVFFLGYALLAATLAGYAAHVALSNKDKQRRADAFRVLKLVWATAAGSSGIVALLIKLHQSGLL